MRDARRAVPLDRSGSVLGSIVLELGTARSEDTMKVPERVTICEVGTRDGFQIEPDFIPTELKVEVVNLLAEAAVPRIEVTSFVHPKVVPQLRDAEEVMAKIRRRPGTRYAALVPNDKGAVRAVDAGVDAIHTVVSASESHNLANVNMTIAEPIQKLTAVMRVAERARVPVGYGSASLVEGLDAMGVETGIGLDKLIAGAGRGQAIVERTRPGQIVKAGKATRRYPLPDGVAARLPGRMTSGSQNAGGSRLGTGHPAIAPASRPPLQ